MALVVEDDEDIRSEILEYFRRRGHEAVGASSIAAGRRELDRLLSLGRMPDAILCDVGLPDGDGVAFLVENAARTAATRWLLMSGGHDPYRLEQQLANLKHVPPHAVIDKPVSLRVLLAAAQGEMRQNCD